MDFNLTENLSAEERRKLEDALDWDYLVSELASNKSVVDELKESLKK